MRLVVMDGQRLQRFSRTDFGNVAGRLDRALQLST
jgi:hypothetical protein